MRPKIYLFGDSITEESFGDGAWGASLAHHFSRTADVVLRGYSGYNTRWALKVVERVFPASEGGGDAPLAVTVFFGANDASLPERCSGFQHMPLHEYKHNLHPIVAFLKAFIQNLALFFTSFFKVYKGNENYRPNFSTAERISRHDELRHHMPQIYQEHQNVNGESSHSEDEPDKETGETNAEEGRV